VTEMAYVISPNMILSYSEEDLFVLPNPKRTQKLGRCFSIKKWGFFASSATSYCAKITKADPDVRIPSIRRKRGKTINIGKQLREIKKLQDNWDGSGAAAPNAMAFRNASDVLLALHQCAITPTRIEASVEEGITFSFAGDDKYAFLEIYNDGDIAVGYFRGEQDPVAYEFESSFEQISQAAQKVCEFIDG